MSDFHCIDPSQFQGKSKAKSELRRRVKLYNLQHGKCCYCEKPVNFEVCTIEHLEPRALGGKNHRDNLAIACRDCNHHRPNFLDWLTWKSFVLGEISEAYILNEVLTDMTEKLYMVDYFDKRTQDGCRN